MIALLFALLFSLALPASAGELTLAATPTEGQPVTVQVDAELADGTVSVVYRPGTVIEESAELGLSGTSVQWTPLHAGIATLTVSKGEAKAEQKVSVYYPSTPLSGVGVFLFASVLLFGSAAYGMRMIFAGADEGLDVAASPLDT